MKFTVPGNPVGMQRARVFTDFRTGKIRACSPQKSTDFKAKIAFFARQAGAGIIDNSVILKITVFVSRPKYLDKCKAPDPLRPIPCGKRPDLDNYVKSVMDALNGISYRDDGQVYVVLAQKFYHEKDGSPRTEIEVFSNESEKVNSLKPDENCFFYMKEKNENLRAQLEKAEKVLSAILSADGRHTAKFIKEYIVKVYFNEKSDEKK